MMSIDRMAQVVLRRQGIGVRERVVRFRGATLIFRYNDEGYDVLNNGEWVQFVKTKDINEAVRLYKTAYSG